MPFKKGNILIPKDVDMTKWSVVACDQYTSEPDYWNEVKSLVGDEPSTLNLTLPEIYLEESDVEQRIKKINKNMEEYLNNDLFKTVILDGALHRKTFSMGHSNDKRFYLEARKIK